MRVNDIVSKKSVESIFEDLDPKSEVYVDMDGVLADFFGVWNQMMGVKHWKDIKDTDAALQKIKDTKDFWINLPMTSNAKNLLNAIKTFKGKYNILSAPLPGDPNSEPQKRAWIRKHLSMFPPAKIIIDHNKAAYAKQADGTPNALIDDFGENISKWRSAGGIGIQHKDIEVGDTISKLAKELEDGQEPVEENFADGKVKGKSRPGRVKKSGASCNGSVTELRAKAKKASGEKAKMYHWCANMKSGKKK